MKTEANTGRNPQKVHLVMFDPLVHWRQTTGFIRRVNHVLIKLLTNQNCS